MNIKIRRFVSSLTGKNKIKFFIVLALVCILAICVGIYGQFFYRYSETDPLMMGINLGAQKSEEEYAQLEADFSALFTNSYYEKSKNTAVEKIENSQQIVYTNYNIKNEEENYYSVDVKIPVININTENAKQINTEIKSNYYDKANNIMRQQNEYVNYKVSYVAYLCQDVLSVVIKSTIKEGENPEREIIKTYNYSLPDDKQISLTNLIESKGTTTEVVQAKIEDEIKMAYNNAQSLPEEFRSEVKRDLNSSMYKVENTRTFFITQDGYVYIVYSYGENLYTNEKDIVIF